MNNDNARTIALNGIVINRVLIVKKLGRQLMVIKPTTSKTQKKVLIFILLINFMYLF